MYEHTLIVHASPSTWALLSDPLRHALHVRSVLAKSGYVPSSTVPHGGIRIPRGFRFIFQVSKHNTVMKFGSRMHVNIEPW